MLKCPALRNRQVEQGRARACISVLQVERVCSKLFLLFAGGDVAPRSRHPFAPRLRQIKTAFDIEPAADILSLLEGPIPQRVMPRIIHCNPPSFRPTEFEPVLKLDDPSALSSRVQAIYLSDPMCVLPPFSLGRSSRMTMVSLPSKVSGLGPVAEQQARGVVFYSRNTFKATVNKQGPSLFLTPLSRDRGYAWRWDTF